MLEIMNTFLIQKNSLSYHENNFLSFVHKLESSERILNHFSQFLLSKEIEFDNVSTEEKKENNKNIVSANFVINNLLNILNKKDINCNHNSSCKNTVKKKINNNIKCFSNESNILRKIKNFPIKKEFSVVNILPSSIKSIRNKNNINIFNNTNTQKNICSLKLQKENFQNTISFSSKNKHDFRMIKDERKIIFSMNPKNRKNNFFPSRNFNRISSLIKSTDSLKNSNKEEDIKFNIESFTFNNSKNSIEWGKCITQKILLSIANKDNQAEIYLKPKSLGSLNILINMKNNRAALNFISDNNEVRIFLDSCIPFLRDSFAKHGLKLENFNISSTKNHKSINHLKQFKTVLNIFSNTSPIHNYKKIDMYI